MQHLWIFKTLELYVLLSVTIRSCQCQTTVKMEVTINVNYMTLSCLVTGRDIRKNIYLHCPLVSPELPCRENCMTQCPNDECLTDSLITCRDRGLDVDSNVYQIDYIIDASKSANHGQWRCQYAGKSSPIVYVNAPLLKTLPPITTFTTTSIPSTTVTKSTNRNVYTTRSSTELFSTGKRLSVSTDDLTEYIHYDKLLTKSEFIYTVIGILTVSVLFNIFFLCRVVFSQCKLKKNSSESNQGLVNITTSGSLYNHMISQPNDVERTYEDTTVKNNQIPLLNNAHTINGTYVTPHYPGPTPCYSTSMRSNLPLQPQVSFADSMPPNGRIHRKPAIPSHGQLTYFTDKFSSENPYSNFQSEYTESDARVTPGTQKQMEVYSTIPLDNANGHYRTAPVPTSSTTRSPQSSITTPYNSNSASYFTSTGMTNLQLSRQMMEEADNLLRTADTLLKYSDNEMSSYQE